VADDATRTQEEAQASRLEDEIAEVCGLLNAATGRLVELIAKVLATEAWQGWGIRSAEQWVAWKCGVSPARARTLVAMARRLGELPETKAAFEAGELSEDQAAAVCRLAPAHVDGEVATLARAATVTQLRRALASYAFAMPRQPEPDEQEQEEIRRVSFGSREDGSWSLSAVLPPDEGALWERALSEARQELFAAGQGDPGPGATAASVSWTDAFVGVAERSLAEGASSRPHYDRHLVLLHLETKAGETAAHLHLGPGLPEGLRRFLTCDSRVRPVFERGGVAVSVGRALRTVPLRTRMVVEERDRGCRVPGCQRSRWLHVHHVKYWEDGGPTDTANLICLCSRHHRLHHLGRLGISGDADDPNGLVFTDQRGRPLTGGGKPAPPRGTFQTTARRLDIPEGAWSHPTGETLDLRWLHFQEA
jgi:hypothetical protein